MTLKNERLDEEGIQKVTSCLKQFSMNNAQGAHVQKLAITNT